MPQTATKPKKTMTKASPQPEYATGRGPAV